MKRLLVTLSILMGILTGCVGSSDSDYISTVKQISFDNGEIVESIVKSKLTGAQFQELYGDNEIFSNMGVIVLLSTAHLTTSTLSQDKNLQSLRNILDERNIIPVTIEDKDIKWEVEGETKKGKTIKASTAKAIVKISTEQDGDYIRLNYNDIKVFNKTTGKGIKDSNIERYNSLNESLINFDKIKK